MRRNPRKTAFGPNLYRPNKNCEIHFLASIKNNQHLTADETMQCH